MYRLRSVLMYGIVFYGDNFCDSCAPSQAAQHKELLENFGELTVPAQTANKLGFCAGLLPTH